MASKKNEEVVLSRLVRLFRQSPLMYLSESNIWTYRGDESLKLTLVDVVSDHQNFVDRAETILVAEQFELPQSFFPLAFTGWHDVDLAFLLPTLIADLEKREKSLQTLRDHADEIVGQGGSAAGKTAELVREAISAVEGHLDMLRQQEKRLKNNVTTTAH
ncbi:MAG: hypothetical protein ACR2NI_09210 [Pirellulales bacterium]